MENERQPNSDNSHNSDIVYYCPFGTGGGGYQYEYQVLASFVVILLTKGSVPMFPNYSIEEIQLQTKNRGYCTDDFLIRLSNNNNKKTVRLLGQIKHSLNIIKKDDFINSLKSAWQDYNNKQLFNPETDNIFFITDTLNSSDYSSVLWLLENSRKHRPNEFFLNLNSTYIPSIKTVEKYNLFKTVINNIRNNGSDTINDSLNHVNDEDIYRFFQHLFILRYDFGRDESVFLSLIYSYISIINKNCSPKAVWAEICEYTADMDKRGGTITYDNIPDDLKAYFESTNGSQQLPSLSKDFPIDDINNNKDMQEVAPVLLLGSWDEKNSNDISIVESLLSANYGGKNNISYGAWVKHLYQLEHLPGSPFTNINSVWTIKKPEELIAHWGSWIYEIYLTQFERIVKSVFRGDGLSHNPDNCQYYSKCLCKGIGTTVSILSSLKEKFTKISSDKIDSCVDYILYILLEDSNVKYWSNIEELLPLFAEASPFTYLSLLQKILSREPSPIRELFCKSSYMYNTTGIVRSLEILTSRPQCFQQACRFLVQLASIDKRTSWGCRPTDSLQSILQPRLSHTLGDISSRISVLRFMFLEYPDFAWNFLLDYIIILETKSNRLTPNTETPSPSEKNLHELHDICEDLIIQLAVQNTLTDWKEFLNIFHKFSDNVFNKFINNIQNNFDSYSEEKKYYIWKSLSKLVIRHKNHKTANWVMNQKRINALDQILEQYKPKYLLELYKRLFDTFNFDLILSESEYDYDTYSKELESKQIESVQDIYNKGGIPGVIEFVHTVQRPECVGSSLGTIGDSETDQIILTDYLSTKEVCEQAFLRSYIWNRFVVNRWSWVKTIDPRPWTIDQRVTFLCCLPLGDTTWSLVNNWLGDQRIKYWEQVTIYLYLDSIDNQYVINNLLISNRYDLLLSILWDGIRKKKSCVKINDIIQTLTNLETWDNNQSYTISELIKYLQQQPIIDMDKMFDIELKYYSHKDRSLNYLPLSIERKLIKQPELFCKYLTLVFKPDNPEKAVNFSEDKRIVAEKYYYIFDNWSTIPGTDNIGCFSPDEFLSWFESVYTEAEKIGYAERFTYLIGRFLTNAPSDDDGFWIHHTIAKLLNKPDMDSMREGYYLKNNGVYSYTYSEDSIHDELMQKDKYVKLASDSEKRGYGFLADLLNRIADFHQSNINEIKKHL